MRHILLLALILGLTFGFAPVSHAKDELNPNQSVEGDGKDVGDGKDDGKGGEEECDPKVGCAEDDGKGGGEGVSGSWHNYEPGSKALEQKKAELNAIKDSASPEAKAWLQQNREEREAIVNGGGGKK